MTRWQKPEQVWLQFLTGNVYRRIALFKREEFCRIFLDSLNYCRQKCGVRLYGFVIMPEHFHLLVGVPGDGVLSDFLRDWKGFTAHTIIKHLQKTGEKSWLKRFQTNRTARRRKDSRFRIFQPDTHVEAIISKRFAKQKLEYIHKNPVQAGLVERIVDYPYSSARNWLLNDHSVFRIDPLEM